MLPIFVSPLAFVGLLALPALAAIYLLRNRHRRQPVSSLLLWLDPRESRDGGTRLRRLRTPLLFFLELAFLLLLVLAAAGPHVHRSEGARPLVVVLDDSFSMLAGDDDSARNRAVKALEEEFRRSPRSSVRLVLAGDRPTLLGEPARTAGELSALLEQWRCQATSACLDESLALASEVGGELALLLVLTDQEPNQRPPLLALRAGDPPLLALRAGDPPLLALRAGGRVAWWAFGEPRPNLAFVNAARTAHDGSDRCLLEVANLADAPRTTTLVITADGRELQRSTLNLQPQAGHRIAFQLQEGTPALQARIDDDDLNLDNHVDLLPTSSRPVRVDVRVGSEPLRTLVNKAVLAAGRGAVRSARADLVVTDAAELDDLDPEAWMVQLLAEKDATVFVGPFVLDRAHPLTAGLSLQGTKWASGKKGTLEGSPVIMAGNVPLLTDAESTAGRHTLRLRFRPDLSTLQDSPNWPVLFANLVEWRGAALPGLNRTNVRLGEEVVLTLPSFSGRVHLRTPDGTTTEIPVQNRRAVVRADRVGVYELRAGADTFSFACNALRREESDLRRGASGRWGDWRDDTSLRLEYRGIAWLFLLLALAMGTLHMALVNRRE